MSNKAGLGRMVGEYVTPAELDAWKAEISRPGVLTSGITYYRALLDVSTGRSVCHSSDLYMIVNCMCVCVCVYLCIRACMCMCVCTQVRM